MDKNKILFFGILLLIGLSPSVMAANWYVDNAVATNGNGQSWGTAWKAFSNIVWSSVQPGDTVYISGGSNSKIYYETLHIGDVQGTAASPILVTRGKDVGHNGRVIIDGGNETRGASIYIGRSDCGNWATEYVTVKGFDLRGATAGVHVEGLANHIIIDSMNITDWYDLAGVFLNGCVNGDDTSNGVDIVTIKNNTMITFFDDGTQTDGIYVAGVSNVVMHDNYIYIRNQDPLAHTDGIQCGMNCEGLKIYNNVIINSAVYSPEGGGMPLILAAHAPNPVIIYNNFLYMGGAWYANANMGDVLYTHGQNIQSPADHPPTYILHNTIVGNGPRLRGVDLVYFGTSNSDAYFSNNIVAQYGDGRAGLQWLQTFGHSRSTPINVNNMKNNLFWREWGDVVIAGWPVGFTNGVTSIQSPSWSQWVSTLGGTGVNANPQFVSNMHLEWGDPQIFDKQAVLRGYLQNSSPAINQGGNIQALVQSLGLPWTDINGNPRDSTPTIGAYEYGSAQVCASGDANCDGCITLGEVSAYVSLWLQGQVTLSQVSGAVAEWLGGC